MPGGFISLSVDLSNLLAGPTGLGRFLEASPFGSLSQPTEVIFMAELMNTQTV